MAEVKDKIKGVVITRTGPRVPHLLFVDDTLVFCQATPTELGSVKRVLEQLEAASNLMGNLEKSPMAFSQNTAMEGRVELAEVLGVQIVEKHEKYLGLPIDVGRSKRAVFQYIKERTWTKLLSWQCLNLLQVSHMVFLHSVIQLMPTLVMGCLLLPLSTWYEIEGMMADFLWHNKEHRHVYWIAWAKLCTRKEDEVLGFR
ncbi:UNVERIFIED_CONTAM: hypothetical protein Sradi_0174600 [Sesamum radiatum]|uniref:Reverse transcriptase domain-containing protein n=1 Tax=Sesamum radiatum TaxID=300843 RepID=A0AAW2VYM4_SESRA